MAWATAPTFAANAIPTSTQMNIITGNENLLGGAWTTYTPSWTSTGTAPAIGNGTIVGGYKLVGDKTLVLRIVLVAGTTTTFGTGTYALSLPAGMTSVATEQHGNAKAACAGVGYGGYSFVAANATAVRPFGPSSSASTIAVGMDATHPATFTATASNSIAVQGTFEIA